MFFLKPVIFCTLLFSLFGSDKERQDPEEIPAVINLEEIPFIEEEEREKLKEENLHLRVSLVFITWRHGIYESFLLKGIYEKRGEKALAQDNKLLLAFMADRLEEYSQVAKRIVAKEPENALAHEILAYAYSVSYTHLTLPTILLV